ncbi:hypothetical protein [Ramlibacter tataouinensis]|uniref:Uncharacterized protein n=1 Tax=Ramlibacter tataouinensis (strain ATCC BAA-407 / DSM 14655 / LMG 21543 / TTB310) TaxID=365046 RepID=F5Y1G7_RAMTT|nr:hypothetical protein [Ramlibacter tataouinensis]AEG94751.1 hypothetical protein Rta_36360 [Ramlibacter tataouinensis TTB310]
MIAIYGLAKLLEAGDHAVFQATGQWLSGHSLKHLVAAAAAVPVVVALGTRQNAATIAPTRRGGEET